MKNLTCAIALALTMTPVTANAAAPETIWAASCAQCHGLDASAYARKRLKLSDDCAVAAQTGKPVSAILAERHGRLNSEDAEVMADFLARQLR